MRIGEIAVVGPHIEENNTFIRAISDSVALNHDRLTFGRFHINDQFVLHLYGITVLTESDAVSWEVISEKILGYVVIFRWGDADSFRKAQALVDHLTSQYEATIVVAGHTLGKVPALPAAFEAGIPIDKRGAFTFCNVNDAISVRKVLLTLVDQIVDQIE